MIRLKRILAATDFSDCSTHSLRYACEFAEAFGADLHLLYVNAPPAAAYSEFGIGDAGIQNLEEDVRRDAEDRLKTLPDPRWQERLEIIRAVVTGTPFVETVRYARQHDIDLIVLGTHGRGAISHMLMGSTAEKVVRKAPCQVMTVRLEAHEFVLP